MANSFILSISNNTSNILVLHWDMFASVVLPLCFKLGFLNLCSLFAAETRLLQRQLAHSQVVTSGDQKFRLLGGTESELAVDELSVEVSIPHSGLGSCTF